MVLLQKQKENRLTPRLDFHSGIRYQLRGRHDFANAVSSDISCGGLRFTAESFIPTFAPLMLEINVLNRVLRPVGKVVWSIPLAHSDRNQTGIEFVEFNGIERNYLKDFIDMRRELV